MKDLVYDRLNKPSLGAPFVGEGVSRAALIRFLEKAKARNVDIHAFQVWRDNELKVRMSLPPYDCTDKRQYYSLSKSFTATAIGLACDEGLLTTDTRLVDLFPDKLPEKVSDNLSKCRVRHVLSMNSGVAAQTRNDCINGEDVAKAFLAADFVYEPGTHFLYDTGATTMLAAIVKKVTGMSALDYLDQKIFRYMDIRDVYWDRTADGTIQGGTGFHASCDDAAKLGLLYLNRGMWNGRRLLSEAWVEEASTTHSDNRPSDWPDWESGYCYQFWTCSRGGYRGDGAFGQYSFILPDKGVVASALCEAKVLQNAVDVIHEMALELFDDPQSEGDIEKACLDFYAVPKTAAPEIALPRFFKADENKLGITYIKLFSEDGKLVLGVSDGLSLTAVSCGNGQWIRNRCSIEYLFSPGVRAQTSERTAGLAASYENEGDLIRVELRSLCSPHHLTLTLAFGKADLTLTLAGLTADRYPQDSLHAVEV